MLWFDNVKFLYFTCFVRCWKNNRGKKIENLGTDFDRPVPFPVSGQCGLCHGLIMRLSFYIGKIIGEKIFFSRIFFYQIFELEDYVMV